MLLIIISWIYILFTTINFGFLFNKFAKINSDNFVIKSILGLFVTTILATIWALFGRINLEFHVFLFSFNILIFLKFRNEILNGYLGFYNDLKSLDKKLIILLSVTAILLSAQCSTAPYLADNESYFIQTIKWLNEYGLVKGLVNLHIFLGQTSGWHICQSAYNFSFIYSNFNDLSGFCLLIGNVFAFQKLDLYFKTNQRKYLIIGLFPIFNLLFFRFISAPSPDIPVYIFSFIVFYYFIENFKNTTQENFRLITILVLFILFIKTTSLAIILLPIILFTSNFKVLKSNVVSIITFSAIVLSLYITKNVIVTGYPFYPLHLFGLTDLDYCLPEKMLDFLTSATQADAYWIDANLYQQLSFFQLAKIWFTATIVDGFFNLMTLIVVLVSPFLTHIYKNEKSIWIIYLVTIVQLIIMFLSSPQYRYFIHFILFLILIFLSNLLNNRRIILSILILSNLAIAFVLLIPMNFKTIAKNDLIAKNSTFLVENIVFPASNSSSKTAFEIIENGNLKYNSPIENTFFWGTGNGNLPAVNKLQIDYFQQYYHVIPQQRTTYLKDGFYTKKL